MRNLLSNKEVMQTVRSRVISLLRRNDTWEGTMTDLLDAITTGRNIPEIWPSSPSSLRRVVNKVVPALRREGYRVQFSRSTDQSRRRLVTFTRTK